MRPALLLLMSIAALGAGCSKKSTDPKDCTPLTVTVDGAPLTGLVPTGLARMDKMGGETPYEVEIFNHAKITCEQWTNKNGRVVEPGELGVRALAGGSGMMGKGVGIESHMQFGGDVSLVGAKPKAVGDKVTLCASEITFTPRIGDYKDKKVTIAGRFEGTYCGEMEF